MCEVVAYDLADLNICHLAVPYIVDSPSAPVDVVDWSEYDLSTEFILDAGLTSFWYNFNGGLSPTTSSDTIAETSKVSSPTSTIDTPLCEIGEMSPEVLEFMMNYLASQNHLETHENNIDNQVNDENYGIHDSNDNTNNFSYVDNTYTINNPNNAEVGKSRFTKRGLEYGEEVRPAKKLKVSGPKRQRAGVGKACVRCGDRKIKCDLVHPSCRGCMDSGMICQWRKDTNLKFKSQQDKEERDQQKRDKEEKDQTAKDKAGNVKQA
ncbi:uncharacterized protein L201_008032 [Kwoniella dendrophila CBS 6074]|uniref:Zn(2)-C6 fungal-type domain-containing protein n=1 Tax=Kwoniella dendrophila CBS 6074 TaxID=1295534 RepID=A0AAX4K668_9TREE